MSIQENYPLSNPQPNVYSFYSMGKNGIIKKVILYQFVFRNRYNLAFGDLIDGKVNDEIISNNNDLVRVISTVALSIYKFTDKNPDAIIEIQGVDKKRTRLYNSLFQRKFEEIDDLFIIKGWVKENEKEEYNPKKTYQGFEIQRKK